MSVPALDVKKKILKLVPGPFCTAKRVYNSFSSSLRQDAATIQGYFEELQAESLGEVKVGRSCVFYKAMPPAIKDLQHKLAQFELAFEEYESNFLKRDELTTWTQRSTLVNNQPTQGSPVSLLSTTKCSFA